MPWAHPRSRGENDYTTPSTVALSGSSPLTRGKQVGKLFDARPRRLIPAHAGKTSLEEHGDKVHAAHPRSRGENRSGGMPRAAASGSSPLTRGKLVRTGHVGPSTGLIPAHAGKTGRLPARVRQRSAHPRSRGENEAELSPSSDDSGSSPLTRGKQIDPRVGVIRLRLIPAHAGKTPGRGLRIRIRRGSSPLTRGKLFPAIASSVADGLIPAHAGKT